MKKKYNRDLLMMQVLNNGFNTTKKIGAWMFGASHNEIDAPRRRNLKRPGRICKQRGCKTALNAYNKSSYCYVHATKRYLDKFDDKRFREHLSEARAYRKKKAKKNFHARNMPN